MPRSRPQEHRLDVPYPITGAEVEAMFRTASTRPPWPDIETCELLAIHLSNQTAEGRILGLGTWTDIGFQVTDAEVAYREQWNAAVKTLRRTRDHPYSFPNGGNLDGKAADTLDDALNQVVKILDAKPRRGLGQTKAWAGSAISLVSVAASILKDLGLRETSSRMGLQTRRHFDQVIPAIGTLALLQYLADRTNACRGIVRAAHEERLAIPAKRKCLGAGTRIDITENSLDDWRVLGRG